MKTIQLFTAFVVVVLLTSCFAKKKDAPKQDQPYTLSDTMAHMIQIDSVQLCNVNEELQLSGEVSYDENKVIKIFPRSSGQVLQSPFSLGDKVAAGQVLAVIKSADVAGNYADVSSAKLMWQLPKDKWIIRKLCTKMVLPASVNTKKQKKIIRRLWLRIKRLLHLYKSMAVVVHLLMVLIP